MFLNIETAVDAGAKEIFSRAILDRHASGSPALT
jgi:hypothetical protein